MSKKNKTLSPNDKVASLNSGLLKRVAVSDVCDQYGLIV